MAQFGQFSLALAFVVTLDSIAASLPGIIFKNDKLLASGPNATIGTLVCTTMPILSLAYLVMSSDPSIQCGAEHSKRELPLYFNISSLSGGQEGSLLLWG